MSIRRAALLLLAVAGCRGDRIEYHRVELPGFSLEVPAFVNYGKDPATEYRAGEVEGKSSSHLVVLTWRLGPNTPLEEMPTMARALRAGIPESKTLQTEPARALQINGNNATQIEARLDTAQMSYTEITCGKRAVIVYVVARTISVRAMRDRILNSFACRPIATQEAAIDGAAAPFGIDDPALLAGWHRVNNSDEFTMSNGKLVVFVSQRPRMEEVVKELDRFLPAIMGASGSSWTKGKVETRPSQGGERTFHHGQMSTAGEMVDGIVTVWHCPERTDSVMALAFSKPGGKLEPAIDLLTKLRCARPDDPPLPLAPEPKQAPAPTGPTSL